jgi:myo-inositol 2-dehydrogenase/D-chiro-inositol 1-dehydrogenase
MKVGVIGTGGMGTLHARHVAESRAHALAGVMDVDASRAREAAAGNAGCDVFTDALELIRSDTVEAVIIASPDETHAPLAIACLDAGKPVLVEKPLAPELDEARAVVEAEVALGRRLVQVGFMRHHDQAHLDVRRTLDEGTLGTLMLVRGWHRNPPPEPAMTRREVLVRSAIHDIESARWLFGREPVAVSVVGPDQARGPDDAALVESITMTFEGGGMAVIEVNVVAYAYEVGIELVGDAGIATTPLPSAPIVRAGATVRQAVERSWSTRFVPAYRDEVEAWLAGTAAGSAPAGPSAWDGYATLAAVAAAVRSVEEGRPVAVERIAKPALYA